jgi:signal transduction histidine kinase/CheY-like chemotaxis protein
MELRNETLEKEVEDLHVRLEHAVLKEQRTTKEIGRIRELKQQLLSIISHEIRTPMNGVLGMSLLLEDTSLTKDQKEHVDTIRSCGESLLTTVNNILANDLLDFSKLQQEGNKLEYKDFDLRNSMEEVMELFAVKTGQKGMELVYDIDEDVPVQIIGDSKRLRQVLMNLIENAVKFTQKGEIFVGVHYTGHSNTGYPPELQFEVRDTGIGIAVDQIKNLFKGIPVKEFQGQSDGSQGPHNTVGTGLGLVICKKLVELMGGRIEVKSQPEKGSSFIFYIPITPSLKAIRKNAYEDKMAFLESKRILIVDDHASSRTVLVKQLNAWKLLPFIAESGQQALEILSTNNAFDVVLIDIQMPGIDGLQLAKVIREQYPSIPMIAMNNAGNENYKQRSELFSAVLTKPIRQSLLREYLHGAITKPEPGKEQNVPILSEEFSKEYPLRILVAEDNNINQRIAIKILAKLGYKVPIANNGLEALEMVSQDQYDIILMDVQMPEMNGLEATRMIRTCLEIQPIIIALTANAMHGDRDDCIQAGMDDYMSKPIELKELMTQLEKWALVIRERRKLPA